MPDLLTVDELVVAQSSATPPLLLDVRWQLSAEPGGGAQPEAYAAAHLPGAHFVDLEADLCAHEVDGQGRHPLPDPHRFEAAMRRAGVTPERTVVAYDGGSSMGAARLWWLLTDAGHPDVRVLDGGLAAWQRAGQPLESGPDRPGTPSDWSTHPGRRERAQMTDIALRQQAGARVIDVRAAERFRGETEPLDPVAGHIPGARNVPIARLQNPDGTLRDASVIRAELAAAPGDVFTCGSGITASLALLAYESAGGVGAVIYPGSWSQWSRAGGPVETGEPGLS